MRRRRKGVGEERGKGSGWREGEREWVSRGRKEVRKERKKGEVRRGIMRLGKERENGSE